MRKEVFVNEERYHVFNRGVEKRQLFIDENDLLRFIHNLERFRKNKCGQAIVSISAFVLMPNHFHLLIQQLKEDGISTFLNRVELSYAMYFNKKHERWGSLFGGRFSAKHVRNDAYFLHLTRYIHRNPIPLLGNCELLESYRWSSYRHYLGIEQSDVIRDSLAIQMFGSSNEYRKFMSVYLPCEDELIEDVRIDV